MTRLLRCDMRRAIALAACLVLAVPASAATQEGFVSAAPFGLLGLARFQTARLNVASLVVPSAETPPGPCLVVLSFVDEAGEPILGRGGLPVATEAALLPGQSAFLELSSAVALAGMDAPRRQVRARVF